MAQTSFNCNNIKIQSLFSREKEIVRKNIESFELEKLWSLFLS